ncbi:hypothetical protein BDR06DRAFT_973966 [Suillus hirtellus]|nr:hypothetical protein BDR06DRAFT_973966 [Suillus hirtellus]
MHRTSLVQVNEELKNDWYMAKLNLTRQENKHQFLQVECQDEWMLPPSINIHKRTHESSAKVHAEEAALLRLKIQYCQLTALLFDILIATLLPIIICYALDVGLSSSRSINFIQEA